MKLDVYWKITDSLLNVVRLTKEEARELYDALHAKFGDFDQARELSQLARESVAREMRLAELEAEVMRLKAAGVDDADISALTSPNLADDIEAMIAARGEKPAENPWDLVTGIVPEPESREAMIAKDGTHTVDDADEQKAEFLSRLPLSEVCQLPPIKHPSNTPEPPAEPEKALEPPVSSNDRQVKPKGKGGRTHEPDDVRARRLWLQYREKYPQELPNATVSRVKSHMPKYSTAEVRELIRSTGIDIPEPDTRAQCAANARHAREAAARAVEAFHRYREKYPNESPAKLAGRITALWNNRPSVEEVRRWLNAAGIKVEDPKSRAECAKIARAVKSSPNGYRVIDADVWAANKSIFSSDDLAMLADGGLARIGLARDDEFDDWEAA